MKYSLPGVIALLFILSACGGGAANNAAPEPAPQNTCGGTAEENTPPENKPDDGPTEDPDKWRKVSAPTPSGWVDLSKDGLSELTSTKYTLLKKAPGSARLVAKFADAAAPHASSGTDEEWEEWRTSVSAVVVYNVSETKDDPVESLKKHGGDFIDGFDATAVGNDPGFAVYIHADDRQKWAACVSNDNGTYVLIALVRNDAAGDLMKPYPSKIKPE